MTKVYDFTATWTDFELSANYRPKRLPHRDPRSCDSLLFQLVEVRDREWRLCRTPELRQLRLRGASGVRRGSDLARGRRTGCCHSGPCKKSWRESRRLDDHSSNWLPSCNGEKISWSLFQWLAAASNASSNQKRECRSPYSQVRSWKWSPRRNSERH